MEALQGSRPLKNIPISNRETFLLEIAQLTENKSPIHF